MTFDENALEPGHGKGPRELAWGGQAPHGRGVVALRIDGKRPSMRSPGETRGLSGCSPQLRGHATSSKSAQRSQGPRLARACFTTDAGSGGLVLLLDVLVGGAPDYGRLSLGVYRKVVPRRRYTWTCYTRRGGTHTEHTGRANISQPHL